MNTEKTIRFRAKTEDQVRLKWLQKKLAIDVTSVIKMALKRLEEREKGISQ